MKKFMFFICIVVNSMGAFNNSEQKVIDLASYTKRDGFYGGIDYEAGYQSFFLGDKYIKGQRDIAYRIKNIPYDFHGKTVLDIGSNQGGMLLTIADQIKYGVGIDYNHKLVNFANRLKVYNNINNINFYCFNLEKEPLNIIEKFLLSDKVDICFLLAVCHWIKNWKEVIYYVYTISNALLFEANGSPKEKEKQILFIKSLYHDVKIISEESLDDEIRSKRILVLCNK